MTVRVEGLERTVRELNRQISGSRERSRAGLRAGGLLIQREAQKRVPVEYGDLKRSAFTRPSIEQEDAVEVGFDAAYALYVHEATVVHRGEPRPSGLGVFWGPNGEPQFLANAVTARTQDVINVIASYARPRAV